MPNETEFPGPQWGSRAFLTQRLHFVYNPSISSLCFRCHLPLVESGKEVLCLTRIVHSAEAPLDHKFLPSAHSYSRNLPCFPTAQQNSLHLGPQ